MNESAKKCQVKICQGTACFIMGASQLQDLAEDLPEEYRSFFEIVCVPCLELCNKRQELGQMPYVTVDGQPYADMTREKLLRILQLKAECMLR
ncbi:MAG: NAD(P)H-dependent oxidoreductase subunit E [Planctomycetia bacterium]|nr:NAD(P)H-dependent oxidoreductase subunit E [Planctomycetia bacterium]